MRTVEQQEDEVWAPGYNRVQSRIKRIQDLDNRMLGRKKVRLVSNRRSKPETIEIQMSTPGRVSLADREVAGQSNSDDGDGDWQQSETWRFSYDRPKVTGIRKYGPDSGHPHSAKRPEPEIQWNNGKGREVFCGDVNNRDEAVHDLPKDVSLSPEVERPNQGQSEKEQPELVTRAKKTFYKSIALNQHPGNYWTDFINRDFGIYIYLTVDLLFMFIMFILFTIINPTLVLILQTGGAECCFRTVASVDISEAAARRRRQRLQPLLNQTNKRLKIIV